MLVDSDLPKIPAAWSGKSIVYWLYDLKTGTDQWLLSMEGDRKAVPLFNSPFIETHSQISPDGKWIAYSSNKSGRYEVYVQPFPSGPGQWQISLNGGVAPR